MTRNTARQAVSAPDTAADPAPATTRPSQASRWRTCVLATSLAGFLVGCGDSPPPTPPADTAAAGTPNTRKTPGNTAGLIASADEVAKAARGDLHCPPPAAAARQPGAPVDDVVGVRPGMSYSEAAQRVMCSHPLMVVQPDTGRRFQIETFGQPVRQGMNGRLARERVHKTGKQIMDEMSDQAMARGTNRLVRDVKPGESKWYVGTMGLPGEERVTHAMREEWFPEDRLPPLESVLQALVDKYGEPTRRAGGAGQVQLTWVHTPEGQRVPAGAPLASGCGMHPSPESGVQLNTHCGVVVAAHVHAPRDNPALAQYIQVGTVDQAAGYALLERAEQALQAAENQRRAQQVQEAAKNAKGPTL